MPHNTHKKRGPKKQKKPGQIEIQSGPVVLPDLINLPTIKNDENKPPYSYSQLIATAISHASYQRLTLAQLCKWISDSFGFYSCLDRNGQKEWRNSVSNDLSRQNFFYQVERQKGDPGKGKYWCIKDTVQPLPPQSTIIKTVNSSKFPDDEELSSDATIPASDPAIHDGIAADDSMMPPHAKFPRSLEKNSMVLWKVSDAITCQACKARYECAERITLDNVSFIRDAVQSFIAKTPIPSFTTEIPVISHHDMKLLEMAFNYLNRHIKQANTYHHKLL